MSAYRISVIIPYYNSADTLERLLLSVGNHADVETIVINDRSTKEVEIYRQICGRFSLPNFRFLENATQGKGAGVCRNIGLDAAGGDWLLFADADDRFLPGWYETVCAYTDSPYDEVCFFPEGNDNGTVTPRVNPYQKLVKNYCEGMKQAEFRLRLSFFPPWSKLIRREFVEKNRIRFDEVRYSNDVMFSTKVGCLASAVTASPERIYCLCETNPGSLTKQVSLEAVLIRNEVCCRVYAFLKARLSRKEFNGAYIVNVPIVTLFSVLKDGFGLKGLGKLLSQYRKYRFPLVNLSWENIKKYL